MLGTSIQVFIIIIIIIIIIKMTIIVRRRRTRPRAILPAMITMGKATHGFLPVLISMVLRLAAGAPLRKRTRLKF